MGILGWIIFGALVGWIASILMHTRRRGLIRNIIVGLLGSFLGGWIASFFGIGSVSSFSLESFGIALGGAVLLIWLFRRL
ncbi:MAG: GlsB/YeaQ/YmgE family stress response membrane protein [Candidatus Izemoplasmataceae bacterium]|uniref:Transglycosylase associated protein n=1 Tax=Firmicutes bacterium enrichment culture clone fosmid MGS-M1 TaxID=1549348 RepID=A0A0B5KNB7_9FIRM|nr:transglycosylase associated protein [Firmicutes bacterium enrichment culture clone fosmid MGS-M1]